VLPPLDVQHPQLPWAERRDPGHGRPRTHHEPVPENTRHGVGIEARPSEQAGCQQGPNLRSEGERPLRPGIRIDGHVERLHAEWIPGQEKCSRRRVPERQRKHPSKRGKSGRSLPADLPENDLGVTSRLEGLAGCDERGPELDEVVYLSVVYDD
jgi:hypothetical protein